MECAICLSEFVKGERIRILPCHHIFHLDEVDSWLIQRKKLVRLLNLTVLYTFLTFLFSVLYAKPTSLNLNQLHMISRVTYAAVLPPLFQDILYQLHLPNERLCLGKNRTPSHDPNYVDPSIFFFLSCCPPMTLHPFRYSSICIPGEHAFVTIRYRK